MKNGEVLKKKRQQEGKVMKDSELCMIETMLKKQEELNSAIMKEYGLTTISKEQIDLATLDEIGEFTHELKGIWCWWKFTQKPVNDEKVLGELVDIWHFVLSYTYNFCEVTFTNLEQEGLACLLANIINEEYANKLFYLIAVSMCLGFTIEDVYKAYCDKNKVNYQRLERGY